MCQHQCVLDIPNTRIKFVTHDRNFPHQFLALLLEDGGGGSATA